MTKPPTTETSRAKNITALAACGFTLIPLNGKIPAVQNWQKSGPADYPAADLIRRGGNYGVALKPGDLVIDVDPRNFAPGDKPLARLVEKVGPLAASFVVRTGGGGMHIYLRKPADVLVCHTLKEYPGIEFKTMGRQVVGPGSLHPDTGKEYTVVSGECGNIKDAPAALLELLRTTAVPFAECAIPSAVEYQSDEATQMRYVEYLQKAAPLSVEGKQGDATAYKVACFGRDLGLPPALTLELMGKNWNERCQPPWGGEELEAKVINAYKYGKKAVGGESPAADFKELPTENAKDKAADEISWVLTRQGQIVKCFYNLLNYLRLPSGGLYKLFVFNEFTGVIEFARPAPWHNGRVPSSPAVGDHDLKLLKGYLATKHNYEASVAAIEEAVTNVSHGDKIHPVREYLMGLKWDGVKRLDTWLQVYAKAEGGAYVQAVGRKVLCAAVARILRPGCKFDHILVLEGEQGIGKSRLCKILGGEWFADFTIDPHNRDTIQSLQGKWIVELAEMSVLNDKRTEAAALKAFVTRQTDKARLAFGRLATEFPRQCIFIGTINPEADVSYLKDSTGNRRFWPVRLEGHVDFKALAADRHQLFAEAVHAIKGGEKLFMDTEKLDIEAREAADLRHAEHPWTGRVAEWIGQGRADSRGKIEAYTSLTARDIFVGALGGLDKQLGRREVVAIATIMRALGWESTVQRLGGFPQRVYKKRKVSTEDPLEGLV